MLAKIRHSLIAFSVSLIAMMGFMTFLAPTSEANAGQCSNDNAFLSFPKWYRGLCNVDNGPGTSDKLMDFQGLNIGNEIVIPIAMNIVDILLQVAAIVAMFFVIYNGIMYMTSRGNKENTAKAQKGLIQATAGLVLAVLASTIVSFIVANIVVTTATNDPSYSGVIPTVDPGAILGNALNLLWWLVGIICVAMILYSSFQYLTSRGFQDRALTARWTLLSAVIGLVLTLLAAFITNLVINIATGG